MKDGEINKNEVLAELKNLKKKYHEHDKKYIRRNIKYRLHKIIEDKFDLIDNFRKRWKIPYDGFKTTKECHRWWHTLPPIIKSRRRQINYFEEEQIIHIKDFHQIFISSTPSDFGKRKKVLGGRSLKHLFIYEVEELMADCKIDIFYYYIFEHFLLYNEINMNFFFDPGFAISIKTIKGKANKILYQNIGVFFSPNTRLRDVKTFAFPIIKYYQSHLTGYHKDTSKISKYTEEDYSLGPHHFPKQTNHTWFVSHGSLRTNERSGFDKKLGSIKKHK